ncbi:MAG TPA: hypothetical protein VGQ62_11650 [Chloroflexota bacterium]|jgi:hypothetical protein|nr:hypothetical protein [Chloroflexota bacterium]
MSIRSIAAPLTGLALLVAVSAPPALAAGGSGGGGSKNVSTCIKVSSTATAAFSYYSSLTLSDTVQNCGNQAQTLETVFSAGSGASAGCATLIGAGRTYQTTVAAGGRLKQQAGYWNFDTRIACAVGDPIIASVVAPDGTVLATTTATWQTGVTP